MRLDTWLFAALAVLPLGIELRADPIDWVAVERVANYELAHQTPPQEVSVPNNWVPAAFYSGLSALDRSGFVATREHSAVVAWGEAVGWKLAPRVYHADDLCFGQTYLDLYENDHDPRMLAAVKERCDYILSHPPNDHLEYDLPDEDLRWSWCDTLYMAPPVWVHLSALTGNPAYLEYAVAHFWHTSDYLYDPAEHLYFRDSRYFTRREKNGQKIFWSRGNGWVLAGMARVMENLPAGSPAAGRFEHQFREMAERIRQLQRPNGGWASSLLDPESCSPSLETSGTGFYCYALAWGVNHRVLPAEPFAAAARKAWAALQTCVEPSGRYNHVQPVGGAPTAFPPSSTAPFGIGAYLLAAVEIGRLRPPVPATVAPPWSGPDPLAHLRRGHPRLLLTDAQLAVVKRAAQSDPLQQALQEKLIGLAVTLLKSPPVQHLVIGPRMLDQSRVAITQILTEAMAYRLSGEKRFLDRARFDLLTVAHFADWHPAHFLDVAEMSFAVGIGYDWLYAELSPEDRATLKRVLLDYGLAYAPAAYDQPMSTDSRTTFANVPNNWNQVCNGGLLTAALAIADEEPATARLVIAGVRQSLPRSMAAYQPDGAYPEGAGYWTYGTEYNVITIAECEGALGTDFGLGSAPAFNRTTWYRLATQGPSGIPFNYADAPPEWEPAPAYTWLAGRYGPGAAVVDSREQIREAMARNFFFDRFAALYIAWCPPAGTGDETPLDVHFRGRADLALFRSAWNDPAALFVGFKGGSNEVGHAHLDLGSFVLDADHVRWAADLGRDNYDLPDYFNEGRWSFYRLNNHSHNTVTPGTLLQDLKANAPIVDFASAPGRAYAIMDLTGVYPGTAQRRLRGIAVFDRSRVLVQDEWVASDAGAGLPLHWGMMTPAYVGLSADGRSAELASGSKRLRVEILAPADVRFTVESARPPTAAENQNDGMVMLVARVVPTSAKATAGGPNAPSDAVRGPTSSALGTTRSTSRLAILLSPEGSKWPVLPAPPVIPLEYWKGPP